MPFYSVLRKNYIHQHQQPISDNQSATMKTYLIKRNPGQSHDESLLSQSTGWMKCFLRMLFPVDAFAPKNIAHSYQKRGTMENYIKESKHGFFDHMSSSSFHANQAKMMLSLLAYNLINRLRTLCFPKQYKRMQIQTIRTRIIKIASRLVRSARSLYFRLSSSFVYQKFFWEVFRRIQRFRCE